MTPYVAVVRVVVHWVGAHVFHLSEATLTYHPTGSGDTAKDWIETFCYFVVSLLVMIVWSILDRERAEYTGLHAWLRVMLRYMVGLTLLEYGACRCSFRLPVQVNF